MRNRKKENLRPDSNSLPPLGEAENSELRPNGSHGMTLNRPFGALESEEKTELQSNIEYHLTIQLRYSTLTRRDLSLLLDVLNYQAVEFGVNFTMLLALWELYFRLLGSKTQSLEISDPRIRLTLTVSELILKTLRSKSLSLQPGEFLLLPDNVKNILRKGLMSKRTYGSRFTSWRPEKFLEARIVPVDIQFLERNSSSQPYSSYCKGYGESHPSAHRSKTKFSADLDGDGLDYEQVEELKLFARCTVPIHVLSEYLLIRYHNEME